MPNTIVISVRQIYLRWLTRNDEVQSLGTSLKASWSPVVAATDVPLVDNNTALFDDTSLLVGVTLNCIMKHTWAEFTKYYTFTIAVLQTLSIHKLKNFAEHKILILRYLPSAKFKTLENYCVYNIYNLL